MSKQIVRSLVLAGPVLLLAGCFWTDVPVEDVEKDVKRDLQLWSLGEGKVTVDCPGDLKGKEGESITCDVAIGEFTTTAEVSVDSVVNNVVTYEYELAEEPKG